MRVHLGSDHAGLELKDHLLDWLVEHGYEPVDHGPFVYDALDDYPVFCLRAAEGVVADRDAGAGQPRRRHRRLRQRRADRGQQGARASARRWPGPRRPRRSPASTTTPTWSRSAAGCTRVEDMTRFVEVFLATPFPGDERHVRRIGQLDGYETTRELPPLPESAPAEPAGAMPEGHTLHRLADELTAAFGGRSGPGRRARRAGSPTPPALLDGQVLVGAEALGQAPVRRVPGRAVHPRPPRPVRQVRRRHADVAELPAPVGQVRLRLVADDRRRVVRRPARRHPLRAAHRRRSGTPIVARSGPDPLRPDADPEPRLGSGSAAARRRSAAC